MLELSRVLVRLALPAVMLAGLSCGGGGGGGGESSRFAIHLEFETSVTATQRAAFEKAAARINAIVTSQASSVAYHHAETCGQGAGYPEYRIPSSVDGLLIFVEVQSIDNEKGILASSGPCYARTSNGLPSVGIMTFDSADITGLEEDRQLEGTVLHEMLHVVGFGTLWPDKQLLKLDTCTVKNVGQDRITDCPQSPLADPRYLGAAAIDAYKNGNGGTGDDLAVENTREDGTWLAHWRKDVFGDELMTGWFTSASPPLSRTTIASLADLGYAVDLTQADPYTVGVSSSARELAEGNSETAGLDLSRDIRPAPVQFVDDSP